MASSTESAEAATPETVAWRLRRERAVSALLPLFFVSGATALIYQTIWARQLHLVFGTSTFAIATVLAAFMAGLAAGGFAMGRLADDLSRPLRAYGVLEIAIGVYAVVFPFLLDLATPAYLGVWRALQPGPVLFGLIQFALVGVLLLVPTAAMGATLPLLARFATERMGAAGDRVGTLYAVNTAGAVVGTWFAGFVLLPGVGLHLATLAAAAANLLLGGAAVGLDSWARRSSEERLEVDHDLDFVGELRPEVLVVAVSIGLAGFASLVYEVAWFRVMGLMLGASVYAFSTMLLAFLVGIAAGGKIGGRLADWSLRRHGQAGVLRTLALLEVGVAVTTYLLMYLYPQLPYWYVWLFDAAGAIEGPSLMWVVSLVLAGLVMTPPAVLMGMAFPVAVRAALGDDDRLGGPVGTLYGANTLGGVVGAFLAGFVLLPGVQVQGTIFVGAAANLLAAAVLLLRSAARERTRWIRLSPVALLALLLLFVAQRPPWDPMLMTAGMYQYVSHFENHSRAGITSYAIDKYELVYYREGLSTVVTVAENIDSGNMWLANNGKVDASTTTDMPTQVLCSLLPLQFSEDPADVLVIGLASGITAGAVTLVDSVQRLDIVELEPAIRAAAAYFGEYNHDVLRNERVNLIHNDGRNHILLSPEGSYDVIVSEPSNPWITGVSNLFTREFFALGKSRLKPGGVWSQWVQMYGMDESDLRSLLRTFSDVYPHVLVYATIEDADLVLIGSDRELSPTVAAAEHLLQWPRAQQELATVDAGDPLDLVAIYQLDRGVIEKLAGNAPLNTDDNMRIEYSAPMHLHEDTQTRNMRVMMQHAHVPYDAVGSDPQTLAKLGRNYQSRGDVVRSVATMARAIGLLTDDDPRRERWLVEAEGWQAELVEELEDIEEEKE